MLSVKPLNIPASIQTSSPVAGLGCEYTTDSAEQLLASAYVLAVIDFDCGGADKPDISKARVLDPRFIDTGLTIIPLGECDIREVWYSSTPVTSGTENDVRWVANGSALLVSVTVDESQSKDLHEATYQAYKQLLGVMSRRGCSHIIRAWNYLAEINVGGGDSERYKCFCSGRHEAFIDFGYGLSQFPAACALGHQGGSMVIYLLAATEPALHFENPQQVSAYKYPREYGARSPSFARAALKSWERSNHIYISGTASIIGHRSLHPGDVARQLQVTFDNIAQLLKHIQAGAGPGEQLQMSMLKIYVRNAKNLELIRLAVEQEYGADTPAVFVLADICRRELEVEIDGICSFPENDPQA